MKSLYGRKVLEWKKKRKVAKGKEKEEKKKKKNNKAEGLKEKKWKHKVLEYAKGIEKKI